MQQPSAPSVTVSSFACLQCRRSKRRCDRIYPECKLCLQRHVSCSYPSRRKERVYRRRPSNQMWSPHVDTFAVPNASSNSGPGYRELSGLTGASAFLAVRFLDPALFYQMRLDIPETNAAITTAVVDLVGGMPDVQTTAEGFFNTIHTWMPIVSKKRFSENLINWFSHRRLEFFLLILSMKLCMSYPTTPRTTLYRVTKQLLFDVDSSGILSIQVLQARILIALYELGHAIYPATLLSVGDCASYASALGLGKTKSSKFRSSAVLSWIEVEEDLRVWWAIIILDRFLSICDPKRQLLMPDLDQGTYLPVDDAAWDAGPSEAPDALTIGSSSGFHLGRFARFSQAAHLLTQAIHQAAEDLHETTQLQRTLFALVNLSEFEGSLKRWVFCTQMSVCFSAVLLLENTRLSKGEGEGSIASRGADEPVSAEAASALQGAFNLISYFFAENEGQTCDGVSPFIMHFLYTAATMCLRQRHNTPTGCSDDRADTLKRALSLVGRRWLGAGTYISLLDGRQILWSTRLSI